MFIRELSSTTKTLKLFDDFEKSKEARMLLNWAFTISYTDKTLHLYRVGLIIENFDCLKNTPKYYSSNITMTDIKDLKKDTRNLNKIVEISQIDFDKVPRLSLPAYHFLYKTKNEFIEAINSKKKKEFLFKKPILLNAQNSSNRTGYGNEYFGDLLIYEGTHYGETTGYLIIGFTLS